MSVEKKPWLPDEIDGVAFGYWFAPDKDNFFLEKDPYQRLRWLGWLDGCPDPVKVAEAWGLEWVIKRYWECNFWSTWILEQVKVENSQLAVQLLTPVSLPVEHPAKGYDPDSVPASYLTTIFPASTPWGYALSRVLIEQLGRQWRVGEERVSKGLRLLNEAIKASSTPVEFLVVLADKVTKADAGPTAVLSHVFAVELEEEGKLFLVKQVAEEVKEKASELWQHYLSLSLQEREKAGIIATSLSGE